MPTKICRNCKQELCLTTFGKNKAKADGHAAYCKPCRKTLVNARYANDILFREQKQLKTKEHNREVRQIDDVKAKHALATKTWQTNNPGYGRAAAAYAKASKRQKTPAWADKKQIAIFYRACPAGFEVDHVVPLNGEQYGVCGLHVLENLQYLTKEANAKKKNYWNWETQS